MTRIRCAFVVAALSGLVSFVTPADAAVTATMVESGNDVVITGSGTVTFYGFSFLDNNAPNVGINPSTSVVGVGLVGGFAARFNATMVAEPTDFGAGSFTADSSGSGDLLYIDSTINRITVAQGFTSGSALSFSNTFTNEDFASLGVTPGVYVWEWGTESNTDTFTLNILVVPEPASAALLGVGMLALVRKRRR